ncbi:XRE family transcriptional regulator [Pseudomonas syringae pv. tagetis]|uniref:XRE family transcriptional regulator n=1 Tax=Pseudomonas syringae pv. tagetis TaxID=129140 RepID=A0A3M3Z881_9PSED|nr:MULTISPECIES: helix-turn-helix transcriptional regulator [Pseudomonas syringae group]KPW31811.1 XRE family transcriptional regulator [Pseudomonas syringae pv. apii]RMO90154.1 XRE family transcriptional regulator [Pseudomonas syringae pv. tagetis]
MIDIEEGSGNVYADLGRADANEMSIKAQLASKIGTIIKARHLTQLQAAEILAMPQPKVSEMLRGKFRGISEAKMMDCLSRLGRDVQIVIKAAPRSRREGRVEVVFA